MHRPHRRTNADPTSNDNEPPATAPTLQLLGRPYLIDTSGHAHALAPLDAALLLLVARRGPLPRDWLAERLWPEDEPEPARAKLRQHVFQLGRRAGQPLFVASLDLALQPQVRHDLAGAKRHDTVLHLLLDVEFPDHPQLAAAVNDERRRWIAEVLDAWWAAAEREQSMGRWVEALRFAEQLVHALPVSERAARLQMTLHARLRDRSAVLLDFDNLNERLHQHQGERPSAETVALVQTIAAELDGDATSMAGATPARSAPLTIGRGDLVAQLLARLEQRQVAVITGMAGIGKTQVIDDVTSRLSAALVCRCEADDHRVPWGALARLASVLLAAGAGAVPEPARQALEAVAQTGIGDAHRAHTVPAVLDAFVAALQALREHWPRSVIVVDDLHFADDDSVKLIALLLDRDDRPGWLLSTRPETMPAALKAWLLAQPAEDEAQLEVPPLNVSHLASWLHALGVRDIDAGAWAGALLRHCGGHPLHTLQVLRELGLETRSMPRQPPADLPVPREAMLRLARRLDACAPETRRLAYCAAVGGGDFDFDLAQQMTGWAASQIAAYWQPLQRLHLTRERHFTHELVRLAVLESLPAGLLAGIHVEIGEGLRQRNAAPARRVRHWRDAGRWRDAADDAMAAAADAESAGLRVAARTLLVDAVGFFDLCHEPARAFALRARIVPMTLALLSVDEAREEAQALFSRAAGDAQTATALLALSQVAAENGEPGALEMAQRAERLAVATADPALQRQAGLRLISALYVEQSGAAAYARLTALRAQRDAMTEPERDEFDDMDATLLADLGQRRRAVQLWLTALGRDRAGSNPARVAEHAGNAAIHLGYLCRTEEALVLCEEAAEIDRRLESTRSFSAVNLLSIAALCLDTGRYRRALAIGEEGVRLLRDSGIARFTAATEHVMASVYLRLGRPDLAAPYLPEIAGDAPAWVRALRMAKRGMLAAAQGEAASPYFDAAFACIDGAGAAFPPLARWRMLLEQAPHVPPEQALDDARRCAEWAAAAEYVALERYAWMTELRASLALGLVDAGARLGDRLHGACDPGWEAFDFDRVELWKAVLEAWDRAGRTRDADRVAATAAAWIERCARDEVPPEFVDSYLQTHAAIRLRAESRR